MNTPSFIKITDAGVAFLAQRPEAPKPGQHDYTSKPVKTAIHHDLSIELHGEQFSVKTKLTADEALGLIGMLSYVLREHLYVAGAPK